MNTLSLNGAWHMYCFPESAAMPMTPDALHASGFNPIPAQVPGNFEIDLMNAGLEEDPFYGENLYNFRKFEFYSFWYERTFAFDGEAGDWHLRFDGVNTIADVFLNGVLLGQCDNMFITHDFSAGHALIKGENTLSVHIFSTLNQARAIDMPVGVESAEGNHESMHLRTAPHSAGWDIMCRLPSAGLWRGVRLEKVSPERFTQVYLTTLSAFENKAELLCKYRFTSPDAMLEGYAVRIQGVCKDSSFDKTVQAPFTAGTVTVSVPKPRLWWPLGYGDANLYTVTTTLLHNGQIVDTRTERVGLRYAQVVRHEKGGRDNAFRIEINGCPILCKGSNWVPLDALHSRDGERLQKAHDLLLEAGCNIVRCWGGNVYEDHAFFDLCDERGMLVWQDFAMACGRYPQDEKFFAAIEKEAVQVIQKLRNHPSILIWAGDNEVDVTAEWFGLPENSKYNEITRRILPRCVRMHDPYREFLPSSPYVPEGQDSNACPEMHNWGPRGYYKDPFYKDTKAQFVSECGYHGCPSPESLRKFIPEDQLWPYTHPAWDTHSTSNRLLNPRTYSRNELMADQVRILCGKVPDDLERFSFLSQFCQAEALKFFIEGTRLKKWQRTGIIWWNMLDGWPQISDAVVDYYFTKKRAFHVIKRIQNPICLMVDEKNDQGMHALVLGNDSRKDASVFCRVTDALSGECLYEGTVHSFGNCNTTLAMLPAPEKTPRLLLLTWEAEGKSCGNHYIQGEVPYTEEMLIQFAQYIDQLPGGTV